MQRQITIANTRTQKRDRFESEATTLGELKRELDARGIDYTDMSFTEGISKTMLVSDSSVLPSNLEFKGQITNDLVILLTNTEKKIASGVISFASRSDVYDYIKTNKLQEGIHNAFGKPYSSVSTDDLKSWINRNAQPAHNCEAEAPAAPEKCCMSTETPKVDATPVINWIVAGIKTFVGAGILTTEDTQVIAKRMSEFATDKIFETGISRGDVDNIVDDVMRNLR
mgnify:CR=1 FL=1